MRRLAVLLVCCLLALFDARPPSPSTRPLELDHGAGARAAPRRGRITVTNVVFTGANVAGGSFTGGLADGLGIDAGVILSSGDIAPPRARTTTPCSRGSMARRATRTSTSSSGVGHATEDAAASSSSDLLVPTQGTASFRYVFASEEYVEFVDLFNDVFAFYVDGVNIALYPGHQHAGRDQHRQPRRQCLLLRGHPPGPPPSRPSSTASRPC